MRKKLLFLFVIGVCFLPGTSSGQTAGLMNPLVDSLKIELLEIYDTDQNHRLKLDSLFQVNAKDSPLKRRLRDSIRYYDSVNLLKVIAIISKYGWLSQNEVGDKANLTIFSVVQHAPFSTQKKLIPIVEKALKEGRLKPSHYALFKDRTLLREGHKQFYGSQISYDVQTSEYFVAPLEDPEHVDERRKLVGLNPLAEYVKQWGMQWNVAEYKKKEHPNLFVGVD